jgi:hypothetical protein
MSKEPKEKVHFSYESNPSKNPLRCETHSLGFFLQSGSIITSTSPGFSSPRGPTMGGQKMVKLTRDEVNWVHEMLVSVWFGMVGDPVLNE